MEALRKQVSPAQPASTSQAPMHLYGSAESWRATVGNRLFVSDEAMRWHIRGDNRRELIEAGLIFFIGRRAFTSDPSGLLDGIVVQLQRRALAQLPSAA